MASSAALHCRLYDSTRQAIRQVSTLGRQPLEKEEGGSGSGNQAPTTSTQQLQAPNGRSSSTEHHQQDEQVSVAARASANDGAGGEPSDAGVGGGRDDECLGLLAEAFADDLDVLRKDSTFTGSSKNIAAMADMMR